MSYQQPPGNYSPYGQPNSNPYGGFGADPAATNPYQPPPTFAGPAPGIPAYGGPYSAQQTEPFAIVSLVVSLVSVPAVFCYFMGLPIGIAAIVFGAVAIGRINKEPSRLQGKGLAYAGIAVSIGVVVLCVVMIAIIVVAFIMADK